MVFPDSTTSPLFFTMTRFVALLYTLVAICAGGCLAQCPPPEALGPCLCFDDGLGNPALRCEGVAGWEEVANIFMDYGITYMSSVDIIASPGLTELPTVAFADVQIGAIRFYNTGLEYLSKTSFSSVTAGALTSLYLKHNSAFISLEYDVLGSLPVLESLYCSYNKLGSLTNNLEPTDVPYMDLSHNEISTISADYFSGAQELTQLLLPFNELTSNSLGPRSLTFTGTADDMYLDLSWNQLSEGVSPAAFGGRMVKEFNLSHNDIYTLNNTVFAPLVDQMYAAYGADAYILMEGNPLGCECDMMWIVGNIGQELLKMAECTDGRLISTLTLEDFSSC